jgi:pimeloyl-ACP methyl ester carboxylesterase
MATPVLTKHELPGVLGPIQVDVRAAGRDTPRPAVVIVHGFKGFKDWGMFPPLADRLARAGFAAVSFNMSGSGVDDAGNFSFPERFGHDTYTAALEDLESVMNALVTGALEVAPPSSIGLLGHSRGGGVAVLEAARDERITALVTWAAVSTVHRWPPALIAEWRKSGRQDIVNTRTGEVLPLYTDVLEDNEANADRLDIIAAAGRITAPWLLLHGEDDEAVPLAEGESLAAAMRHAASRHEWIAGGGHTFGARHPWAGSTPELERAFAASVAWFARHLT